ncbi:MAG TPA: ATP-grasp domain-containing protein [Stellaceae bacterium]|nr:ATP-grasp domain-containing protein [Stellaceae bacterium]
MIWAGGDRAAVNGLMIAFALTLPYHVMRTAAAAGMRVHVLGNGASRGLRMSRHCRAYHRSRYAGDAETLLAEICELVRRHKIGILLPSDDVSTRLLATLGDRLPVPSFPVPAVATFDLLNDKWNFTQFCLGHGVRAPEAWLFDDAASLRDAVHSGAITLPLTIKPTNRSGGFGVFHIRRPDEIALIDRVDYTPVLAQRHIAGESVSITLFCDEGNVRAHVAQERDDIRFRVFANPDLLANASRLAALTCYSGSVNFDAVLSDEDGLAYLVECNPRFWYSVYLVMLIGLNFVELALAGPGAETATLDQGEIRLSLREILVQPWRATRLDWKYLAYNLSDPVAYLAQRANSYDDSEVAVPIGEMSQYQPVERPVPAAPAVMQKRGDTPCFTAARQPVSAGKAP